jgi:phage baseplate assembly protein V
MIINRAVVSLVKDDTAIQLLQLSLLKNETKDNIERIQNYGFTSVPVSGAEAVVLFPNGNRDSGLAIAVDNSMYRLKDLPDGAVAMYHKDGHFCKLTDDEISIQHKNGHYVKLNNDGVEIISTVGVTIGGNATVPGTAPGVTGSFCGLPSCLFTGTGHLTNKVVG